ncbi:acetyl-CoA C-acyltransferase [Rhodococcus sp. DMU1]|uniref:thiolase family protein n=1 Tax=Rhodococcus sp. DMU1 TaxID=2722825 RepID=UPI00143EF42E|nr:acetyl-CoA C-acyltransferase [Rhodococcus sp. DMU1]QIX53614.1 acetyl-CoA C-acyltransferase [Rhodococcus sp. DMU1]
MANALLAGGSRTPIGRRNGRLAGAHPAELLGGLMRATLDSLAIDAGKVDQVITGCVTTAGDQANNVGRTAWLTSGLPVAVPATTIDAKCGSSQQAVHLAAGLVASGVADVVLCAGLEHMSSHPLGQDVGSGMGDPYSAEYRERFEVTGQGEAAERIAQRWKLDRIRCDEIAVASQERAAAAIAAGRFTREITAVGEIDTDEGPRPSTMETLSRLKPVFDPGGVLTAGNSSQVSDGASCVVVVSDRFARDNNLTPLAEIEHQVLVGVDPVIKLTGPIPATKRLLARSQVGLDEVGVVEVNEAFASVLGAWLEEFRPEGATLDAVNVNGGAIALGHPVGATGARLLLTAAHELAESGHERAIVTMCCGGGLGTATMLRALS